jgi:mono/diheme cytochrome c family protein
MRIGFTRAVAALAAGIAPAIAAAYPGGTPNYQTNVAPYCASCHSSRSPESLAGAGDRAMKEVAERKHIAVVLSGQKGYASLGESDRATLADQIRALDAASTVKLEAPAVVRAGETFQVTVSVTGGAGPAVGVALVDRAHRWYARPASSAGWQVVAAPAVIGSDGHPQYEWIAKRPESFDRNVSFVNVTGISSDSAAGRWASATVVFALRAPDRVGTYPLAAAFFYGTEKSTVLGYTTDALGRKEVRGGFDGGSGRLLFTPVEQIQVQAPTP